MFIAQLKPFHKGFVTEKINKLEPVLKPITDKQIEEAKQVGLTCISKSTDPNKNLYKFNDCGHFAYLQPTHVRRNSFVCVTCYVQKASKDFSKKNIQFLYRNGNGSMLCLLPCGHENSFTNQSFSNYESEKCSDCFEEKLKEYCEYFGYEYIELEDKGYRKVRFKSCGHEKSTHQTQIVKGNVVCRICEEQKEIDLCLKNDLKIIQKLEDRYRLFELPCGHQKKIRLDHAIGNSWYCDECEDNFYTKPSSVYLLYIEDSGFSWLKLGFSRNVDIRISSYGLSNSSKVTLISKVDFDKGSDALKFEKNLHNKFHKLKISKKTMKNFHKSNGYTECYPVSYLQEIKNEIERGKIEK